MRISENKTRYLTHTLRSIICEVHRHLARTEGRLKQWRNLHIIIHRSRGEDYTGWATHYEVQLNLPPGRIIVTEVAALVEHELLHCYGYDHAKMGGGQRWRPEDFIYLPGRLNLRPVIEEPPMKHAPTQTLEERRQQRIASLIERRQKWLSQLKRAQNVIAKIDQTLTGYRRRGVEIPELEPVPSRAVKRPKRRRTKRAS